MNSSQGGVGFSASANSSLWSVGGVASWALGLWVGLLIGVGSVYAQNQSVAPGSGSILNGSNSGTGCNPSLACCAGGSTAGTPSCEGTAGNPLNVLGGNKYQREVDMSALPGVMGLELVRHYNSDFSSFLAGQKDSASPSGRGWRLGYDGWLMLPSRRDGKRLGPSQLRPHERIALSAGDGTQTGLSYSRTEQGGQSVWASVSGDRVLTIDPKQSVTPYLIKDLRSGEQRFFDANGLQVLIRLASGHSVRIYRDLHGRIVRVTDPQGRELKLSYPEIASADMKSVLIRQVQHIDTPLGRYSFSYGRDQAPARSANVNGNLVSLAQQHSQVSSLMQLTRPDGSVRHYHYEDPTQGSLLTGISEQASQNAPLVRVVSWSYNSFGRAVRSVKGPIPPEGQRGSEDVSLIFLGAQGQQRRDGSGLTLLTNSEGEQTRYEYEMLGAERQLTLVQGAGCSSCGPANVRYGYDSLGRQVSITNLSPTLVKDGRAQSIAVALSKQELNLDPQGRVLSIVQTRYQGGKEVFRNVVEQREYSDANWPFHPTRIKRPSVLEGREHILEVGYSSAGQIEQIRESGYSPLDNLGKLAASANDASKLERITRLRYEVLGGLTVLTEVDGPLANGPHASPVDSDITRYQWAEDGLRLLSITRPMGLSENYEYEPQQASSAARLIARTDALGVRTELTFQPHSTRLARIGRAGLEVTYGYDLKGRVISYRRNDGAKILVQYDDDKKEVLYSLPDGEVRKVAFDREGRIKAQAWADAQGKVLVGGVKFEYGQLDSQGLQEIRLTDDSGVVTRTLLNPSQASRSSERGQGEAVFRQTEQFDATQHLLLVQRNEALSQVKDEGPGSPNTALQASLSLTLPHGAQHRQWRDDFGRVVRLQHPETGIHRAAYDEADRQTARWDSSRLSSARYDALGRLVQLRHANTDGASVQTANAVVKAVVSAEEETTWEYGQGNEGALLKRQASGQQDQHYAYDSNGRLIEERLSIRRQGASEAQEDVLLPELVTRYTRDAYGRIQRIHLPEGAVLTQRYNAQGRIEAIALQEPATKWWHSAIRWVWAEQGTQDLLTGVAHSSSRGLQGYQHANGAKASSAHDQAGRLTQWADGPFKTELGFNQHAQLASLKTQAPVRPGPTLAAQALRQREQNLSYDPFGRLRQVNETGNSQGFDHDRNGNRIAQASDTLGQRRFALAPSSDRLLSIQDSQGQSTQQYDYNSAGEPIRIEAQGTSRALHYNAIGQIGAVEQGGQLLVLYAYNGQRQRVAKTVSQAGQENTTTYFTWHGGLLDAELDSQGRVERRTIYFNLRPVALLDYGYAKDKETSKPQSIQHFAIHGDHLGTPQAITDDRQRVVWVASYDSFGRATAQGLPQSEVTAQTGSGGGSSWIKDAHAANAVDKPFEFHLRFAGQYEDAETGWHYNWHRYYDPETGRYLTPDPIGLRGGDNAYGYAGGDPLGAVDPWGLYSLVVGFEVNRTDAFAGGIHDLGVDYGHMYYYLVDNDGNIADVFSFGPNEPLSPSSTQRNLQLLAGRRATADYQIVENSRTTVVDINVVQYGLLRTQIASDRLDILIGRLRYREITNTTCASTAVDNLSSLFNGLGIPVGRSPVRLPSWAAADTDRLGITRDGLTPFSHTNPYAQYQAMVDAGFVFSDTLPLGRLGAGDRSPVVVP